MRCYFLMRGVYFPKASDTLPTDFHPHSRMISR